MCLISVSVFDAEGPPVPIPNTVVKLCGAHNTRLVAASEDRSMLTQKPPDFGRLFHILFLL